MRCASQPEAKARASGRVDGEAARPERRARLPRPWPHDGRHIHRAARCPDRDRTRKGKPALSDQLFALAGGGALERGADLVDLESPDRDHAGLELLLYARVEAELSLEEEVLELAHLADRQRIGRGNRLRRTEGVGAKPDGIRERAVLHELLALLGEVGVVLPEGARDEIAALRVRRDVPRDAPAREVALLGKHLSAAAEELHAGELLFAIRGPREHLDLVSLAGAALEPFLYIDFFIIFFSF